MQILGLEFNPLFIYGTVGSGKTHLLHSIGLGAEGKRVVLISCHDLINYYMEAMKEGKTTDFRDLYRSLDYLMVDDIQFLKGREQLQEEFFSLFNTLMDNKAQIVLTSDRPPDQLDGIPDRLVSRFQMGLVTDVRPANKETREAILSNMADRKNWKVDHEILTLIAETFEDNVRKLQGALLKIMSHQQFSDEPLTVATAKEILAEAQG